MELVFVTLVMSVVRLWLKLVGGPLVLGSKLKVVASVEVFGVADEGLGVL